jgi:hypothetical protein
MVQDPAIQAAIEEMNATLQDLINERDPLKVIWQDVTDFVLPRRANFDDSRTENVGISTRRTDSTATEAAMMLADGLMGYCASAAYPWFKLRFDDDKHNKIRALRAWLDQVTSAMYVAFSRSNFYAALPEVLQDAVTIGTATLYADEIVESGIIQFIAIHPLEIYLVEDHYGRVIEIYRWFKMSTRQAIGAFGEEYFQDQNTNAGTRKHNIVNVVRANTGLATDSLPFESVYYNKDAGELLKVEGYHENPYLAYRYRKNTGETYGRSPAIDYLPDILRLQQISKSLSKGVQLAVEPPVNAPASMKGKINLTPNGVNYYTDPAEIINPVNYRTGYNLGENYHQMLMDRIRKAFHADTFLSLEAAKRQMTAEEVLQRKGEQAAVLGAIVGRLGQELLDPIIKRVFGIEMRAGRLPPPPDGIESPIKIEFDGPLFQAQKRYHQTSGIRSTLADIMPLGQAFPQAMQILNGEGIVRQFIDAGGMPATTYRDEQEVARMREAQAQAEAAAMAAQKQQMMIESLPKMNQAPEPGSPIDRMAQATQQQIGGMP